jgi:hypothetical protein
MINPEIALVQLIDAYTATSYVVLQNGEAFTRGGRRAILRAGSASGITQDANRRVRNGIKSLQLCEVRLRECRSESPSAGGPHEGVDCTSRRLWTGERWGMACGASFLEFRITRNDAEAIGRRYQQNAILWIGPSCVPELVILVGSEFIQD